MRLSTALREALAYRDAARQTAGHLQAMHAQVAAWENGGAVTSARQLAELMAARQAAPDREAA